MSEWAVSLVCGLLGVQTTILIAAIPWAYSMHGRVTRIEAAAGLAAEGQPLPTNSGQSQPKEAAGTDEQRQEGTSLAP